MDKKQKIQSAVKLIFEIEKLSSCILDSHHIDCLKALLEDYNLLKEENKKRKELIETLTQYNSDLCNLVFDD